VATGALIAAGKRKAALCATAKAAVGKCKQCPNAQKPRKSAAFVKKIFGAGEAIRTLDPNLGKVVLYP
jgi:hypothetical protein